jgi:hypothetical protein
MDIPLDEVIHFDGISSSSTGAAVDADSTPTFAVYEEATDTDIGVGGNMTKRTSQTGNYRGSFTASAANGFEVGKWYSVIGSATIGGIATKGVLKSFRIVLAESVVGEPKVDVGALGGGAQSLTDLKDFADTGYDPATHKVQGVVLVDTLTAYTGNTPQTADHAASVAAIKTKTDQMAFGTANRLNVQVYGFEANTITASALATDAADEIAVKVESHLLDEGDSQMLINAIVGAIGNTNIDQAILIAAIRADLERSGGNLHTLLSRITGTQAAHTSSIVSNLGNVDLSNFPTAGSWGKTVSTINAKMGAITGTGNNTLLGYHQAQMLSTAGTVPSDIGGGYIPAAHSLEAASLQASTIADTVGHATYGNAALQTQGAAVKAKTDLIPASPAAVGSAMTLAAGAISDSTFTVPDESVAPSGIVGWIAWFAKRMGFRRVVKDGVAKTITVYKANGTTPWTVNEYETDAATDTTEDVSAIP